MLMSVVVPTYNRCELLKQCIDALLLQDFPQDEYEIIIVNDCSSDQTHGCIEDFRSKHTNILVLSNIERRGHAVCRNSGFAMARGEFIASTDDDCVVPGTWLSAFFATFRADPFLSAVGGSIMNGYDRPLCWAEWMLNFSPWYPYQTAYYVKSIPTANIAYRRANVEGLSFAVDSIDIAYRDTLFNFHLIQQGKKILFNPSIMVMHYRAIDSFDALRVNQEKFARGFMYGGFVFHGLAGRLVYACPWVQFTYLRLLIIAVRSSKKSEYLLKFFTIFPLLFWGETMRILSSCRVKYSR